MSSMYFVLQGEEWFAVTEQMFECDIELQRQIAFSPAAMTEQTYKNEKELQGLIENYSDVLAGDQIDIDAPRKWLLVKREMGVPDTHNKSGRWSLDHLFLDQDGVPTLVEVKLRTNTLLRREVIGQMLDYATHGLAYWTDTTLRANFNKTCSVRGDRADQKLDEFLGISADTGKADETKAGLVSPAEKFWQKVKTNLQVGELRLIFVADGFPEETLRVIEFLNKSMPGVQALAVEIKQSISQRGVEPQIKTLISRVVRHTETRVVQHTEKRNLQKTVRAVKGGGRQWDEALFFVDIENRPKLNVAASRVARSIIEWTENRKLRVWWHASTTFGSFVTMLDASNGENKMFAVKSSGSIEFYTKSLSNKHPFEDTSKRNELFTRLSALTGKSIEELKAGNFDSAQLSEFGEEVNLTQLLSSLDWIVEELKRANA